VGHSFYRIDGGIFSHSDSVPALLRKFEKRRLGTMNAETILALIISVLLMAYLIYALLRPERF
jgi:K+-transporting ATPase KdpF subunit